VLFASVVPSVTRKNLVNTQMDPIFHPRWHGFVPCRRNHGRDNGRKKHPCKRPLRAVYTRVFCVRFSVRDGATAQLLPLLFSRDHVRDRAKENVGRRRHRRRRNGRKKREYRRPFNETMLNATHLNCWHFVTSFCRCSTS
jgi:hypothetical protein